MKYTEKNFDFIEIENEGFAGDYIKMPTFVGKLWMKSNVKKLRSMMGGLSKDISTRPIIVEDKNIKGYKNDIRIRIYRPEEAKKRPVMIFIHGGGWFAGAIDAVHDYCKAISDKADTLIISVDYGLAPENPYPTGVEDCYAAVKWAIENKDELNIDTDNVIVSGDSAGGNYSAVISIMARDRKEFNISKQILLYPATDLQSMEVDNSDKMAKIFSEVILEWYLKKKSKATDKYVSPMYCDDLSNLASAFIVVGDLDFLHESSLKYAEKLEKAGNEVKFSLYKNTRHAFIDNTGNCPQADALIEEVVEFIKG